MENNIRHWREARGLSRRELAEKANTGESQIVKLERGERRLTAEWMVRLASALDVAPADLLPAKKEPPEAETAPFAPVPVPQPAELRRGLPVYGAAACGTSDNCDFEMNGQALEHVAFPPALADVRGAYGLYATGDSMEPRYFAGELVYVHPHKAVQPGNFAVIQMRPLYEGGAVRAMIKRLVRRTKEYIEVEQFNPPEVFKIPAGDVIALHRILSGDELF